MASLNCTFFYFSSLCTYLNHCIDSKSTIDNDKNHGKHNDIHAIPIGVPINFFNPFPKIQIKSYPEAQSKGSQT